MSSYLRLESRNQEDTPADLYQLHRNTLRLRTNCYTRQKLINAHEKLADIRSVIIPYMVVNKRFITLYGIIKEPLSANYLRSLCNGFMPPISYNIIPYYYIDQSCFPYMVYFSEVKATVFASKV